LLVQALYDEVDARELVIEMQRTNDVEPKGKSV
jgi:hypothetical protein